MTQHAGLSSAFDPTPAGTSAYPLFVSNLVAIVLVCWLCAGEMGSRLDSEAEHEYYSAVSAYVGLSDTSSPGGSSSNSKSRKHLSGWIWSGYSNGTGHAQAAGAGRLVARMLTFLQNVASSATQF